MVELNKHAGGLQARIAAGKADPISERERVQLRELQEAYARRFGTEPGFMRPEQADRSPSWTGMSQHR